MGREVRRRIMLGTYVLSSGYYDAYYNKANFVRNLIKNDFSEAFKEVDLIATPTALDPRFQNRRKSQQPSADVSFGHVYNPGKSRGNSGYLCLQGGIAKRDTTSVGNTAYVELRTGRHFIQGGKGFFG